MLERAADGAAEAALPGVDVLDHRGGSRRGAPAERGYLREAGNLLFHVSVLVVLVGFAYGQLFGYKGGVITVVGQGFSNSLTQYDDFAPGSLFDPDDLPPLSFTVDDFQVKFLTCGPADGAAGVDFAADSPTASSPARRAQKHDLAVNHPLSLDGVSVFLVGHGYAPGVTVRDGNGNVAYQGPVRVPAAGRVLRVVRRDQGAATPQPEQLGFEGLFLPTYGFTMATRPVLAVPRRARPGAVAAALPRRPRPGRRQAAVGLRARHDDHEEVPERRPRAAGPSSTWRPARPCSCPTGRARSASTASTGG